MRHGRKFSIKVVVLHAMNVGLEVVARDDFVSLEKDADRVVNGGTAGNDLRIVLVELGVDLVDITAHSARVSPQVLQVVPEGLGGCDGVDCRQPHDDFVHQRRALNSFNDEVLAVS